MNKNIHERLQGIDRLAELDILLDARERIRRCWTAMHSAAMASESKMFTMYAELLANAGREVNVEIELWFKRALDLHADNWSDRIADDPFDLDP